MNTLNSYAYDNFSSSYRRCCTSLVQIVNNLYCCLRSETNTVDSDFYAMHKSLLAECDRLKTIAMDLESAYQAKLANEELEKKLKEKKGRRYGSKF